MKTETMTKVASFEIINIENEDKKTMRKILGDLRYDSRNMANDIVKCLYEEDRFGKSVILNAPSYTQKSIDGKMGHEFRKHYTKFNPSGLETIIKKVFAEWKNNQKKFRVGDAEIISYKNANSPLYIRNNQMKIKNVNNKYSVFVRLLSKKYAEELENGMTVEVGKGKNKKVLEYKKNTKGINLDFNIIVKGNHLKSVIDRLITKEYKIGTSQILYNERKNKWFFNLVYSFEIEKIQTLNPDKIMGIDLGINIPAMLAISDDEYYKQPVGSKDEIATFTKQVTARKKSLQRQRKWCGEGSIGHGTKTRIRPLEKLSGKIARFKDTKNHCWSRYIVNEAIKNNCGKIQMEDLSGISDNNTFLKTWTYFDLQQKIVYKANEVGIEVVKIKPDYTSQRCSKCGNIHKENRNAKKDQSKFECKTCGFKTNADFNAARNIATKDIENIIKEQLKAQGKAMRHAMKYEV